MSIQTTTGPMARVAVLVAAVAGCATGPQPQAWKPAPVGASWTSAQRNTGSYGSDRQVTITRAPDMLWNGSPAMVLTTPAGSLVQQLADGRWLAQLAPDGKPVTSFDPPAGWTPPLSVGSSWRRPQRMTNLATGRTIESEWGCTVAAIEKITVPAGTFDAYRVECTSSLDTQDTYWVSGTVHPFLRTRLVRGPRHPAGPGTQETELLKLPS